MAELDGTRALRWNGGLSLPVSQQAATPRIGGTVRQPPHLVELEWCCGQQAPDNERAGPFSTQVGEAAPNEVPKMLTGCASAVASANEGPVANPIGVVPTGRWDGVPWLLSLGISTAP